MLGSIVSVLPSDWFSLSAWPWFLTFRVENTVKHKLSIITRFGIKFLQNVWELFADSLTEMNRIEMF